MDQQIPTRLFQTIADEFLWTEDEKNSARIDGIQNFNIERHSGEIDFCSSGLNKLDREPRSDSMRFHIKKSALHNVRLWSIVSSIKGTSSLMKKYTETEKNDSIAYYGMAYSEEK